MFREEANETVEAHLNTILAPIFDAFWTAPEDGRFSIPRALSEPFEKLRTGSASWSAPHLASVLSNVAGLGGIGFGYFCSTTTVAPSGTRQAKARLPGRDQAETRHLLNAKVKTLHKLEKKIVRRRKMRGI